MPITDEERDFHTLTIRLPVDLNDQLRQAAQRHERSAGAELRTILRAHLAPRPVGAGTITKEHTA